jgi:hypothetical protein
LDIKAIILRGLLGVALVTGVPLQARAQMGAWRAASVPHLSLRVRLDTDDAGLPKLTEYFSTDDPQNHSVACVSGFLDVSYVLRDRLDHVIAAGPHPAPNACTTLEQVDATRSVLISDLYPNLSPGIYTLQITLAPRNQLDRADLSPLTVEYFP